MEDVVSEDRKSGQNQATPGKNAEATDQLTKEIYVERTNNSGACQSSEESRGSFSVKENENSCEKLDSKQINVENSEVQNTSSLRDGSKLSSGDKRVRFVELEKTISSSSEDMDFNLHSAKSRETSVVWETVVDEKGMIGKDHKISSDSTDSVFDSRAYDQPQSFWEGKEITDLDEDEGVLSSAGLKSKNVFRDLLEERRNQRVSVSEFVGDGGYVSLDGPGGGGGSAPAPAQGPLHSCGSLFAQCGAHRQSPLVTTYSHGRYGQTDHDSDDSYSGPVSLTEILSQRDPMCRLDLPMGNGASTGAKGSQGQISTDSVLLKKEVRHWEERALELAEEVATLRKEVKSKDHEILRLQREVHKLKVSLYCLCNILLDTTQKV